MAAVLTVLLGDYVTRCTTIECLVTCAIVALYILILFPKYAKLTDQHNAMAFACKIKRNPWRKSSHKFLIFTDYTDVTALARCNAGRKNFNWVKQVLRSHKCTSSSPICSYKQRTCSVFTRHSKTARFFCEIFDRFCKADIQDCIVVGSMLIAHLVKVMQWGYR